MIVTSTPRNGYDSWTDSSAIYAEHGSGSVVQLQTAAKHGFVWLPISPLVAGRTIALATLTGHAHGVLSAQTLSVQRVAAKWQAGKVNWNNEPGVTGTTATLVLGSSVADAAEVAIDVTALVQSVASGATFYGFRVVTNSATVQKFAAFGSGSPAWTLTVEYAEEPEAPSVLAPNGSVVGATKPVVTFDFTDYGGTSTDMAALQVQVDTNLDGTVDWDSGTVVSVTPSLDLAAAGMTGTITSGQTVNWRVRVKDGAGLWSAYSDWAPYTYRPLPVLTLDSPAGGVMYDPTSNVLAHITGGTLAAYRVQVTNGSDRTAVRYDSGKRLGSGTSIALALPLRNTSGNWYEAEPRIFHDDKTYQIHVRAWDTYDRQATPGLAAHVDVWATVIFNDDLALAKVTSYQVTQVDQTPFVKHTWTDVAAADAYLISRDGEHIARLTSADVVAGVSTYTWTDLEAAPYVDHVYSIRRITVGVGRSAPRRTGLRTEPLGVWLLRDNGESVQLFGNTWTLVTAERRSTYTPLNVPYTVDILTAYEGVSGHFDLLLTDSDDQNVADAVDVLGNIKQHPSDAVRLIAGDVSKPMLVRNLTVLPSPLFTGGAPVYAVSFDVTQTGEFDFTLPGGAAPTSVGIG